jgi:Fe-S cluster assembly protein SufD
MKEQTQKYVEYFTGWERRLNGASHTPVHALRKAALQKFVSLGFPTTKDEEWRFTNVTPIAAGDFHPVLDSADHAAIEGDVSRQALPVADAVRLVFVDGHYVQGLSKVGHLPPGADIGSLAEAIAKDPEFIQRQLEGRSAFGENAFTALNTAFLIDGAFIRLPDGLEMKSPIHCLFLASGGKDPFLSTPRNLILVGRNASVSIVETYASTGRNIHWTNVLTEVRVGEGALVEHDRIQIESADAFHVGTVRILQERESKVTANSITLGGKLVRNDVTAVFGGDDAECTLNGLSVATGDQHVDNHTVIDHALPNCASHELYKSILDGRARGVFNGKIFVRKDAQKTDAKQTNKTLLLSDDATIDTKPQLEIFADDVKCTHGATVGQLDDEQVFYLRSRGIGEADARDLLTFAFATDIINRIHVEPLRAVLDTLLRARLRQGRVADEG